MWEIPWEDWIRDEVDVEGLPVRVPRVDAESPIRAQRICLKQFL